MIDPKNACLYIPPELKDFKLKLFERIGSKLGHVVRGDPAPLSKLPADITPVVGCTPALRPIIDHWLATGRRFIYWDRGYGRRVFATWLPRGEAGGYYRWHCNSYQLKQIRTGLPSDRWDALRIDVRPWQKNGRHIVIARPSTTYGKFHALHNWLDKTVYDLSLLTSRQLVVRDKETKRPLQDDLNGAHCLVTHGSIAAVEAVICGCPVLVHPSSAAALVGHTDIAKVEKPIYPDRTDWLRSLAYSQFNEKELVDGTLWRLLT